MDVSTGGMMWSLAVGGLGMALFMYGKRQARYPQLIGGVALMVFPYFVSGTLWTLCAGGAIVVGVVWAVTAGY